MALNINSLITNQEIGVEYRPETTTITGYLQQLPSPDKKAKDGTPLILKHLVWKSSFPVDDRTIENMDKAIGLRYYIKDAEGADMGQLTVWEWTEGEVQTQFTVEASPSMMSESSVDEETGYITTTKFQATTSRGHLCWNAVKFI